MRLVQFVRALFYCRVRAHESHDGGRVPNACADATDPYSYLSEASSKVVPDDLLPPCKDHDPLAMCYMKKWLGQNNSRFGLGCMHSASARQPLLVSINANSEPSTLVPPPSILTTHARALLRVAAN